MVNNDMRFVLLDHGDDVTHLDSLLKGLTREKKQRCHRKKEQKRKSKGICVRK
jgi:hypothetical protein